MDRLFSRERTEYGDLVYRFRVRLKHPEAAQICHILQDVHGIGETSYYKYDEIRVTNAIPFSEEHLVRVDVEIVALLAYHLREEG